MDEADDRQFARASSSGLVELGPDRIGFRARFTAAGIAALRLLAQDRRALDPKQYAHIREELEADPIVVDSGTAASP